MFRHCRLGAQYYEDLKTKYENTSDNLIFHGRQTEGLSSFYFKSNLFVLPGLGGLAISESMAYGLPVIASTADGTEKDLIVNNITGILIEEMTSETLFTQIETLYNNRDLLKKMGENAKKAIESSYSFENYYKNFKESVKYACKK
ncbi:glycosyltransferase family 4 protein [Lacinutrix neustonica]|uniref:Glycosyltransferase family 4 protein n=1 Tax=Lacinutrix neustonica TaxID=2980107 RepID=A0A9E8SIQ2_9FLAO|nr:glycosyltransferase family 4 protein [Lacinutrix neustonica]WAC03890.1 glycosyltransferase family 4 protein [Lacinutrix neustonica]